MGSELVGEVQPRRDTRAKTVAGVVPLASPLFQHSRVGIPHVEVTQALRDLHRKEVSKREMHGRGLVCTRRLRRWQVGGVESAAAAVAALRDDRRNGVHRVDERLDG